MKVVSFVLHNNARMHKSGVAQAAIRECKFEQLNQPPYIPDLAPSEYYPFRNLMPHLCGSIFWDNDEFKAATMLGLGVQTDDFISKAYTA